MKDERWWKLTRAFKFSKQSSWSEIAADVASHSWKKPECVSTESVGAALEMANASLTSCEARASQMLLGPLQCMCLHSGSTSKRQQRSQEGHNVQRKAAQVTKKNRSYQPFVVKGNGLAQHVQPVFACTWQIMQWQALSVINDSNGHLLANRLHTLLRPFFFFL